MPVLRFDICTHGAGQGGGNGSKKGGMEGLRELTFLAEGSEHGL